MKKTSYGYKYQWPEVLVATIFERTEQPLSWSKVWYTLKYANSPESMSGGYYGSCFKWLTDEVRDMATSKRGWKIVTNGYGQVLSISLNGDAYTLEQFRDKFYVEQS